LFLPVLSELFFSKNDNEDPRLGDIFRPHAGEYGAQDFVLLGYPDDEGIRLNGGRIGAAAAPDKIRQFLYKMTPPESYFTHYKKNRQFLDYGNLQIAGEIALRHLTALKTLNTLYSFNSKVITLGGGHDYGYPDGASFIQFYSGIGRPKPLIINFDAHLDVRSAAKGLNSGTPFYRLKTDFGDKFSLLEIGLQSQCNSVFHWRWAKDHNIQTVSLDEIEDSAWQAAYQNKFIQELKPNTPVLISFDIDALIASEAGGCSQAWMTGLRLNDCLKFLSFIYKTADTRGIGIYEVSPALDRDFQTSKTAALLIHHFLFKN